MLLSFVLVSNTCSFTVIKKASNVEEMRLKIGICLECVSANLDEVLVYAAKIFGKLDCLWSA